MPRGVGFIPQNEKIRDNQVHPNEFPITVDATALEYRISDDERALDHTIL
jgi:hypothetical protein